MANPRGGSSTSSKSTGNSTSTRSKPASSNTPNNPTAQTSPQPVIQPEPVADPLDFETLPLSALRKYRTVNKLAIPSPQTLSGFMLASSVGRRTIAYKNSSRISKSEAASQIKRHFLAQGVRESEVIVDFIYSVKRQDRAFKLQFS